MAKYFTRDGDEYKEVSENLLTQADVDNVIEKRLERERSKFADYETLQEKASKVDDITKEYQEKIKAEQTAKSELEKKLSSAQLETEKVKITHEFKLSEDLAEFVTGDTAEDMRKRAEKLSKGIPGASLKIEKDGKPDADKSDSKAIAGELFGGKSDD